MHVKPGHFDEVLEAYSEFAAKFQVMVPEDRIIVIAGDRASGLIRGIGVFESATVAADVNSMPFFAAFNDAVEPYLSGAPDRIELELIHLYIAQ